MLTEQSNVIGRIEVGRRGVKVGGWMFWGTLLPAGKGRDDMDFYDLHGCFVMLDV